MRKLKHRQLAKRDIKSALLRLSADLLFLSESYAEAAQSNDLNELYAELNEAQDDICSIECLAMTQAQRIRSEYESHIS